MNILVILDIYLLNKVNLEDEYTLKKSKEKYFLNDIYSKVERINVDNTILK
jgi:hypothetical protein